jgi:hypothetical protein
MTYATDTESQHETATKDDRIAGSQLDLQHPFPLVRHKETLRNDVITRGKLRDVAATNVKFRGREFKQNPFPPGMRHHQATTSDRSELHALRVGNEKVARVRSIA